MKIILYHYPNLFPISIQTTASVWRENTPGNLSTDGNYLLRHENSFLRAKLEKNCELQGRDKVQGKYTSIISRQMEIIVFIMLQMFLQRAGKMLTNSLLFAARHVYFSVFFGSTLETNKHVSSITIDTRSS